MKFPRLDSSFYRALYRVWLGAVWANVAMQFGVPSATGQTVLGQSQGGDPAQMMKTFRVTSTRVNASDVEGPDPVDRYDANDIAETGAFNVDELLQTFPPSAAGSEQLVLVDGRPTSLNLSSLPLDMIEGVEVSRDGSMPQYGAYAAGRVVNIRLKKNYEGTLLTLNDRESFAGGGGQRAATISGGKIKGKFRMLYSLKQSATDGLAAAERTFSRNQDHTLFGGNDWRLAWGYPAVVQAVNGNLNGLTAPDGNPVNVALVPDNFNGNPTPGEFLPGMLLPGQTVLTAAGQRRFNTADYLSLVAPTHQTGANFNFKYSMSDRFTVGLTCSWSESTSDQHGAPPVSPVSAATLVPAADNPFDQDVEVGLVHLGFGPTLLSSRSTTAQLGVDVGGKLGDTWKWNGGVGYSHTSSRTSATDLDPDKFSASLAAADPAQRFNPFLSNPWAPANLALYPGLTVIRTSDSTTDQTRFNVMANGEPLAAWGGPVMLSLGADASASETERRLGNPLAPEPAETPDRRDSYDLFTSVTVPFAGLPNSRAGLRRLETEISGKYSDDGRGGSTTNEKVGLTWVPMKPLLLRAVFEKTELTPSHEVTPEAPDLLTESFIDPRRSSSTISGVQILRQDRTDAVPELTQRITLGMIFEPSQLKGLRLSANFNVRTQTHIFQGAFDPQDVIDNETVFPGRVIRAAPSSQDLALGQPGPITAVDTTPGNAGEAQSRDVDLSVEYRLPAQRWGRVHLTAEARHPLESKYEVQPGVPYVMQQNGTLTPPDWTYQGRVAWSRGGWNASTSLNYLGPTDAAGQKLSSTTIMDVHAGYTFSHPLWGSWGKGVRLSAEIGSLLESEPPYADTIQGYRGGSPLGRAYSCSVIVPL